MTTHPSPNFSGYLASDSSSAWPSRSFTPGPGRTAQAACAAFPSSPSPAHCFTCSIRPDWSRSPGAVGARRCLVSYYWHRAGEPGAEGVPDASLMVPICNVLAYLLGPVAMAGPPWLAVGLTVTSVLLLTARERLHNLARGLNTEEIVTAGKLLLLTGFVLPLLPDKPVTALIEITPRQVWLAMLAVCTISYASYLLQRYVAPPGAKPLIAVLGGFYSSTATQSYSPATHAPPQERPPTQRPAPRRPLE
jgi:hypothetical protein